jgi:hypothetical protein
MDDRGVWGLNGVTPDKEYHDRYGNHYLLMGPRLMKNGVVVSSTEGCPIVQYCRLDGNRLIVVFQNGSLEFPDVYPGPPDQR